MGNHKEVILKILVCTLIVKVKDISSENVQSFQNFYHPYPYESLSGVLHQNTAPARPSSIFGHTNNVSRTSSNTGQYDKWSEFLPNLSKLEKMISLVEDVQAGFYHPNYPSQVPSSSSMTNNPNTLHSRKNTPPRVPVHNKIKSKSTGKVPQNLVSTSSFSHRLGMDSNPMQGFQVQLPPPNPTPMNDNSVNGYNTYSNPTNQNYTNNPNGEVSPTYEHSYQEEKDNNYKGVKEGEVGEDEEEEEEAMEDENSNEKEEEETSTEYYKTEITTVAPVEEEKEEEEEEEPPTTTPEPPFTLNDITVPNSFLRIEYMIGYSFLGVMYGLGFLVLFQCICVPVAKFFVVISYLWAIYMGVVEPITKNDAMQYLPPYK